MSTVRRRNYQALSFINCSALLLFLPLQFVSAAAAYLITNTATKAMVLLSVSTVPSSIALAL